MYDPDGSLCSARLSTEVAMLIRDFQYRPTLCAMRSPVLASAMCYKVHGVQAEGNSAISLCACYAMSGTELAYATTRVLRDV
eukprot:449611-Rhodomonas_salina.1